MRKGLRYIGSIFHRGMWIYENNDIETIWKQKETHQSGWPS